MMSNFKEKKIDVNLDVSNRKIEVDVMESIVDLACVVDYFRTKQQQNNPLDSLNAVLKLDYNIFFKLLTSKMLDFIFVEYFGMKYNISNIALVRGEISHGYPVAIKHNGTLFVCVNYKSFVDDLQNATNLENISRDDPIKIHLEKAAINNEVEIEKLGDLLSQYAEEKTNKTETFRQELLKLDTNSYSYHAKMHRQPGNSKVEIVKTLFEQFTEYHDMFSVLTKMVLILNQAQVHLFNIDEKNLPDYGRINILMRQKPIPILKR